MIAHIMADSDVLRLMVEEHNSEFSYINISAKAVLSNNNLANRLAEHLLEHKGRRTKKSSYLLYNCLPEFTEFVNKIGSLTSKKTIPLPLNFSIEWNIALPNEICPQRVFAMRYGVDLWPNSNLILFGLQKNKWHLDLIQNGCHSFGRELKRFPDRKEAFFPEKLHFLRLPYPPTVFLKESETEYELALNLSGMFQAWKEYLTASFFAGSTKPITVCYGDSGKWISACLQGADYFIHDMSEKGCKLLCQEFTVP